MNDKHNANIVPHWCKLSATTCTQAYHVSKTYMLATYLLLSHTALRYLVI